MLIDIITSLTLFLIFSALYYGIRKYKQNIIKHFDNNIFLDYKNKNEMFEEVISNVFICYLKLFKKYVYINNKNILNFEDIILFFNLNNNKFFIVNNQEIIYYVELIEYPVKKLKPIINEFQYLENKNKDFRLIFKEDDEYIYNKINKKLFKIKYITSIKMKGTECYYKINETEKIKIKNFNQLLDIINEH